MFQPRLLAITNARKALWPADGAYIIDTHAELEIMAATKTFVVPAMAFYV